MGTSGLCAAQLGQLGSVGLSGKWAQLRGEQLPYPHAAGAADLYAYALVAGDFNADGVDDLAVGIPGNDCDFQIWDCGSVQVRFGGTTWALHNIATLDPNGVGAAGEPPAEPARFNDVYGSALAVGDFQNDGYDDLVVGIPGNLNTFSGGSTVRSGAVQIHYGLPAAAGGIELVGEHALWRGGDSDAVPGTAASGDRFGAAIAVGDWNGDGHDDVAIGDFADDGGRGAVVVGHGHIGGLVPFDGYEMTLGLSGLPDTREANEQFGYALAAGNFNGDCCDDLAIGVPSEDDVGAVLVVYGSANSLIFPWHLYFSQADLADAPEAGDRFGEALAAGDFDGDGFDDLAVGAPLEDGTLALFEMGQVAVVHGGLNGLVAAGAERLTESLLQVGSQSEPYDHFGSALTAGDFNGDGVDDLAIGSPDEEESAEPQFANSGGVTVVVGRRGAPLLGGAARRLFPIGTAAPNYNRNGMIPDGRTGAPLYGSALAAGDFDGNGFDDLAIGAPWRDHGAQLPDGGVVAIVFGQLFLDDFESLGTLNWSSVVD